MPVWAANEVPLVNGYRELNALGSYQFPVPMARLDFHVFDAEIYIITSEDDPPTFVSDVFEREMIVYKGFSSIPFETDVTGIKMRSAAAGSRVTLRAFA